MWVKDSNYILKDPFISIHFWRSILEPHIRENLLSVFLGRAYFKKHNASQYFHFICPRSNSLANMPGEWQKLFEVLGPLPPWGGPDGVLGTRLQSAPALDMAAICRMQQHLEGLFLFVSSSFLYTDFQITTRSLLKVILLQLWGVVKYGEVMAQASDLLITKLKIEEKPTQSLHGKCQMKQQCGTHETAA